jgi:hypothetical protein
MARRALRQRYGPLRRAFQLEINCISLSHIGQILKRLLGFDLWPQQIWPHAELGGHSEGVHIPGSSLRTFPTRRSIGCVEICSELRCAGNWLDALITVASSRSASFSTIWLQSLWRSLSAFDISSEEVSSELMVARSLRSSAQVTARSARRATTLLLGWRAI